MKAHAEQQSLNSEGWDGMPKMCWMRPTMFFLLLALSRSLAAQGFTESDGVARNHRDFAGKPRILNHSVSLKNHCSERIKAKVCYYKTDECTDVEVPGNSSKEQIIGVFPAMQIFRYEVKEQF
jgi:hypothetical protein